MSIILPKILGHSIKVILVLFISVSAIFCRNDQDQLSHDKNKIYYAAYYFHPTPRCESCLNLESFTKEFVETKSFDKQLVFRSINTDEEANEYYKKDFKLVFSSLIIIKFKNDSIEKWKNLDSVWSYTNDKKQFFRYTEKEIIKFIEE